MSRERKSSTSHIDNVQIDMDFLGKLGNFEVVDAWEDNSNGEKPSGIKIKEEPVDERDSRDSRKRSSDPRSSSTSSSSFRRQNSRGRSRSPERNRERRDPRQMRNRSPPRRRSPPPQARKGANGFLEELREKFEGKDTSFLDDFNQNPRNQGRRPYGSITQQFAQQQQQYEQMMMNDYQQQQMMQMNYQPDYQQFNPMMQYDAYGNPLMMTQGMAPPLMSIDIPQPVPPPAPGTLSPASHQYLSPEAPVQVPPQQQQRPQNGNNAVKKQSNAMNKALQSGSLNLTDILRQKAKQQSKESSQSAIAATKAKVKENCQKASDLILDLEKMKPIMPFSCALTEVQTPQVKDVSSNKNKSPLLLSDHNAQFQFQTAPQRVRTAFERNPLKLFQDKSKFMLPLARNMKMDMLEVSLKVKQQILTKPKEKEVKVIPTPVVAIPGPSRPPVQALGTPKFQDRAVEANMKCGKCSNREEIQKTVKSKGTQTERIARVDVGTQSASQDGSLIIRIDADRRNEMTFEDQRMLKILSERLGFHYDDSSPVQSTSSSSRRNNADNPWGETSRFDDDHLNYSNPENPASNPPFISFSPPQRSQSIFDRIGEKIPTQSPPQQNFYERVSEYRVPSPDHHPIYRNRSRSLSPLETRMSGGRNRSPMRSRSPGSPMAYRNRSPIGRHSPIRNRSPFARNRSPLRSRGGSPKRSRYDDWDPKELSIKDRRGRY